MMWLIKTLFNEDVQVRWPTVEKIMNLFGNKAGNVVIQQVKNIPYAWFFKILFTSLL